LTFALGRTALRVAPGLVQISGSRSNHYRPGGRSSLRSPEEPLHCILAPKRFGYAYTQDVFAPRPPQHQKNRPTPTATPKKIYTWSPGF